MHQHQQLLIKYKMFQIIQIFIQKKQLKIVESLIIIKIMKKIINIQNLDHKNLKMVLYILDNGKMECVMVKENNIGQMDHFMKDIGEIIWLMVKVD